MQYNPKPARLEDVARALAQGGCVRCTSGNSSSAILVFPGGDAVLDGRTYQRFLKTVAPQLKETRTGSVETKDLVIEWRK